MSFPAPVSAPLLLVVLCRLLPLMSIGCDEPEPATTRTASSSDRAAAPTSRPAARPRAAIAATQRPPVFTNVTDASGLAFVHQPFEDGSYYMPEQVGGGVALFDYDNDGDLDAYFVNGAPHGPSPLARQSTGNRLFRQDPGLRFVDVTDAAGVGGGRGYGTGVAVGDYDNDGDVDLFVTNVGPDLLYRNNGDGTFADVSAAAGVGADTGWGTSATFLDYDRDGNLDLYVAQYLVLDQNPVCRDHERRREYCGPKEYPPLADLLWRNNGDGTFADVSAPAGIAAAPAYGLGVVACDLSGDGLLDVFVANDQVPNQLWVNRGDGTFVDEAPLRGVAVIPGTGQITADMGVAAEDVDDDGDIDLFLTHLGSEYHTLYRNVDNRRFEDATFAAGLGFRELTGWGAAFADYDHDGDLDLAWVNGRIARGNALVFNDPPGYWDAYAEPNVLAENDGTGRFRDARRQGGALCATADNSRGLAWGDVDNDGDVDLLVTNCGGPARLYRNDRGSSVDGGGDGGGHWLLVRAVDPKLKRDAPGAVVSVTSGGKTRRRLVAAGRSYLSSGDPRAHFGMGASSRVDAIEVRWPDGTREPFQGGPADRIVTLEKGRGAGGRDGDGEGAPPPPGSAAIAPSGTRVRR